MPGFRENYLTYLLLTFERRLINPSLETTEQIMSSTMLFSRIVILFELGSHLFFDDIDSGQHVERRVLSGQSQLWQVHNDIALVLVTVRPVNLFEFNVNGGGFPSVPGKIAVKRADLFTNVALRQVVWSVADSGYVDSLDHISTPFALALECTYSIALIRA